MSLRLQKISLVFSVLVSVAWLLSPSLSFSGDPLLGPAPCVEDPAACSLCAIPAFLSRIINYIVKTIVPPLAFLLLVIGGAIMITSTGNEARRRMGIEIVNYVIIGVVIVLLSWIIINTILRTITVGDLDAAFWRNATCQ